MAYGLTDRRYGNSSHPPAEMSPWTSPANLEGQKHSYHVENGYHFDDVQKGLHVSISVEESFPVVPKWIRMNLPCWNLQLRINKC